jgi:hypothetical protein
MPYELHSIAASLIENYPELVKATAPKPVLELFKRAHAAEVAWISAAIEYEEAKNAVPIEQRAYLFAVEQAVIKNEETPQPLVRERAEARERVTARAARDAEAALEGVKREMGAMLADTALRDEWSANAEKKAATMHDAFVKQIDDIEQTQRTFSELIGLTYALGQIGIHVLLPAVTNEPVSDLRKVAKWEPFKAGLNITA